MAHLKDIEKYHTLRCFSSDKEYCSLFRLLFCRLMDVNDKFPGKINGLVSIEDNFRDFLLFDEADYEYKFFKGNDYYRIEIKDYNESENIRFPKCILEDNWEEELKKCIENKRRNYLQKEIARLEESIKNGPVELERLKKEFAELNNLIE